MQQIKVHSAYWNSSFTRLCRVQMAENLPNVLW